MNGHMLTRYLPFATRPWRWALLLAVLLPQAMIPRAVAQTQFPVRVNVALRPPYSPYLSDYALPGSQVADQFNVNIILTDASIPSLDVKLKLTIERLDGQVKIVTLPTAAFRPITLTGGGFVQLSGSDLVDYFRPENLNFSGITRQQVQSRAQLPEGPYRFCVEVQELTRGITISQPGCATVWLLINDPPLLNLPENNSKLRFQEPQNVVFQWTPRHAGSPNSAFSTEYEFTLVEVRPANRNPNDAINVAIPIYQTTTNLTRIVMGPAEPPLQAGITYAWRVRATDDKGFDLFKNRGYSEVYTFQYGNACTPPASVTAEVQDAWRIRLSWGGGQAENGYTVRYRTYKPNLSDDEGWFYRQTPLTSITLDELKPTTTYQFQVRSDCFSGPSTYTTPDTARTQAVPPSTFVCGRQVPNLDLSNTTPLSALNKGDRIAAGDFDVQLDSIAGANGRFTGKGLIVIPFMGNVKVRVAFDNITVNTDRRMIAGSMYITGAGAQLITDEQRLQIMQTITAIDNGFKTLEEGLDQTNQLIFLIDLTLRPPLPDSARRTIQYARQLAVQAKTAIASNNPEEQAKGREQLKKANDTYKQGLRQAGSAAGDMLRNMANNARQIFSALKQALKSLRKESDSTRTARIEDRRVEITKVNAVSDSISDLRQRIPAIGNGVAESNLTIIALDDNEISFPAPDALMQQPVYASYARRRKTVDEIMMDIKIYIGVALYIQQTITNPSKLSALRTEVERDLQQQLAQLLQRAATGNLNELVQFLKNYLRTKLQAIVRTSDELLDQEIDNLLSRLRQEDQKPEAPDNDAPNPNGDGK
jgi:TANFOR domain-containing protein